MGTLSNSAGHRAGQLLKKVAALPRAAGNLLGQDCLLCGGRSDARVVCAACEGDLPPAPAGDRVLAAFAYRFPVDRLVHRFKDRADLALGRWMALALAARVRHAPRPDLVVATPLAPSRLHARGFNQAVELARGVSRALELPFDPFAVAKLRDTEAQRTLGRAARLRNLRGAFRCTRRVRGLHVAVVDDVVTTGATAAAVAAALRGAGASRVSIWAFARTP